MRLPMTVLGLALAGTMITWLWADAEPRPAHGQAPAARLLPVPVAPASSGRTPAAPVLAQSPAPEAAAPNPPRADAVAALRAGMLLGDTRQPPLAERPERHLPTPTELADPALYQAYEARQQQHIYASFVAAADKKIVLLQADIARAKAEGMAPQQVAEGQRKLDRLREQRDQLRAQYPEVTRQAD